MTATSLRLLMEYRATRGQQITSYEIHSSFLAHHCVAQRFPPAASQRLHNLLSDMPVNEE